LRHSLPSCHRHSDHVAKMIVTPDGESPNVTVGTPSTMRRDLVSAYVASVSRIGSWVIVSALVYRFVGAPQFAMLALVRGTIGLLNYSSLGLAPALIHLAARIRSELAPAIPISGAEGTRVISHRMPPDINEEPLRALYANALLLAFRTGCVGILLSALYAMAFEHLYLVPQQLQGEMAFIVLPIGIGTILRLAGDAPGGMLQVRGRIALDNQIQAGGDVLWGGLIALSFAGSNGKVDRVETLVFIAMLYALSGAAALMARFLAAGRQTGIYWPRQRSIRRHITKALLAYGTLVALAQLADYLYSPTDYILIARLLSTIDIANYAPAVQIDSGLLLVMSGLAAVLLPKAALAYSEGSTQTLRRYYVRGTFVSAGLLLIAAFAVWAVSPWLFKIWFGNSMPGTRAILPLVLANTVIGGSGAVGRSILIAVGKAKAFAISVLVAGAVNVVCSYLFVRHLHWGLNGIVLGTVVAVVGRCVIWMPWYIYHCFFAPSPLKT